MISSSSFLIPLREKSSVHPPITSRSPQFGHLHGFFTAGGPKWRPRVNSAKSKLSLVFVRALSVARRPWSPWRANEHRLSQELSTGRRSFPLFARLDDRVTRREPVLSKKTIRNHPLPLVSAPFQLPLLSSTPLSLRTHQASLCLSPSFPFLLSYTHTYVRMYKPPSSTASTRSPLCTPPCHSSISLCLHLSLPFDHQPRPLFLAHSLSFSRRRGTGTRYVILSMARRNMNASSARFRLPSSGGGIAQPTLSGNCNHGNAYLCESIGVWRAKRRWMEEEEGDTFRYRRGWIRAAGNEQRRTRAKRGNFRTTFIGNYCFRPGVRGEWLIIAWGYYLLSRPSHDYLSWNARLPSIVHNYGDEKVFRG